MFEEKDYYMRIVHELVRMLIRKLSLWKCWRNIKS